MVACGRMVLWLVQMVVAGSVLWWAAGTRLERDTHITGMLPQTAPDEFTKQALAHVDAALGQRSLYLIGAADFETARHAAGSFAGTLRASPAYSDVSLELSSDPAELDAAYGPARPRLLSNNDRERLPQIE